MQDEVGEIPVNKYTVFWEFSHDKKDGFNKGWTVRIMEMVR